MIKIRVGKIGNLTQMVWLQLGVVRPHLARACRLRVNSKLRLEVLLLAGLWASSAGSPVALGNKYLYNGKEQQDELEQYGYATRF